MKTLGSASLILCLGALFSPAWAIGIPEVMQSSSNQIPGCATPGRLMAFVKYRNPSLRPRFDKIAVYYMKHGNTLNVRWDYAFFQMLLETNSLKFNGDVNWSQNNFAGLGATGGGVKGERFSNVSDGVRAHLEHLLIYAGVRVEDPVAERTRKVQSWNILASWQRSIRGPMTFGHIGKKWAPGDREYARDIQTLANRFYESYCSRQDPRPDLFAEAQEGGLGSRVADTAGQASKMQVATTETLDARASLGASTVYLRQQPKTQALTASQPASQSLQQSSPPSQDAKRAANQSNVEIINVPAQNSNGTTKPKIEKLADANNVTAVKETGKQVALATGLTSQSPSKPIASKQEQQSKAAGINQADARKALDQKSRKCRVWTASYGGQKAIIIRSSDTSHTNYTVLDVNPGREKQETKAYIAAYAQGGKKIAEFKSQTLALDEAFKLCPEG